MAIATPAILGPSGDDLWPVRRVEPALRREALSVLLTGQPTGGDLAVDQFLKFAQEQGLSLAELWAVCDGPRPIAVTLLVPSPGRTAMIFTSPVSGREELKLHAQLITAACQAQDPTRIRLVQSLLDSHQALERRALERAGFEALAVLIYMQRATEPPARQSPRLDLGVAGIESINWSEDHRDAFATAIEATYQETLDCPRLLGVRPIHDVIAGHMATGRFDPSLWYAFFHRGEAVGVMLLSEIPQRQTIELVYLGVSVPWRGKGLSRRMLQLGLDAAGRRGVPTMVLAVDELNVPALALYRGMAFRPTARKTAMILAFS